MTDVTGLVVQGTDHNNHLGVYVREKNGDRLIYNVIDAGDGNDTLRGDYNGDVSVSKAYGAQLFGEDGNDQITDSVGTDTLSGGAGNDIITSFYGEDVIDGGDGVDTLNAGSSILSSDGLNIIGIEKLFIEDAAKIGDLDLTQFDSVVTSGALSFTHNAIITNVNFRGGHVYLDGGAFDDHFDVSNTAAHASILGAEGDDVIVGSRRSNYLDGQVETTYSSADR